MAHGFGFGGGVWLCRFGWFGGGLFLGLHRFVFRLFGWRFDHGGLLVGRFHNLLGLFIFCALKSIENTVILSLCKWVCANNVVSYLCFIVGSCVFLQQLQTQTGDLLLDADHDVRVVLISLQLIGQIQNAIPYKIIFPCEVCLYGLKKRHCISVNSLKLDGCLMFDMTGYLFQVVHLSHHLVHVSVDLHQIHTVQCSFQQIHHCMELDTNMLKWRTIVWAENLSSVTNSRNRFPASSPKNVFTCNTVHRCPLLLTDL